MQHTRQFIVSGRVQGVGFRAATQDKARELALAGWVRNLPDGRVEAAAGGDRDAVAALNRWLEQGPPAARVDSVDEQPTEADNLPQPFTVR